jgi:hypothetical protein
MDQSATQPSGMHHPRKMRVSDIEMLLCKLSNELKGN